MHFTDDTDAALQAAVALANSTDEPGDPLGSIDDLSAFLARWTYTGRHDATTAELEAVRRLRPDLRSLLLAERDRAAEIVNDMLARSRALPQLQRHGDWDWHLHAVDPDRPLDERVVVETAMAMVDVIRADEMSRLATCAADDCEDVVLDLSRNRSRRFCSTTCGNREAVAAYRARRRS
ncbi:CGNR zinc finger domain-containing protein [Nocardioides sp. zg-1228]|uniref:CGNR zinc finger domain-containing protein n=1 Tax=Nocardioides sp. zg-1228 TaxID=2763008 RepID=UPI001642C65E|nr:CGNR zinc finger domain-containing protein [Nocardioides sp. zg-1228]MBC2934104.1 CGNR zinc finger domain-containing protein [Nocardioides sp. zg-1228]QSF58853.1 CGNR zinc finger domain-containing protein [Nocardioides sp. zg-1228]